jgi:hypothetical protein
VFKRFSNALGSALKEFDNEFAESTCCTSPVIVFRRESSEEKLREKGNFPLDLVLHVLSGTCARAHIKAIAKRIASW